MKEKAAFEKILRCINKTLNLYLNRYLEEILNVNVLMKQYLSIISVLHRAGTAEVTRWG